MSATPSKYRIVDAQALEALQAQCKALAAIDAPPTIKDSLKALSEQFGALPSGNLYDSLFRVESQDEGNDPALLTIPPCMPRAQAIEIVNSAVAETVAVTADGASGGYFDVLSEQLQKHGMEFSQTAIESLECDPWDASERQPPDPQAGDPNWVDVILSTNFDADDPDDIYSMNVYLDEFPGDRARFAFLNRPYGDAQPRQIAFSSLVTDGVASLNGFVKTLMVKTPRVDRYCVPEYATERGASKFVRDDLGLWELAQSPMDLHVVDTGDDSAGSVMLVVTMPKELLDLDGYEPKPAQERPGS